MKTWKLQYDIWASLKFFNSLSKGINPVGTHVFYGGQPLQQPKIKGEAEGYSSFHGDKTNFSNITL